MPQSCWGRYRRVAVVEVDPSIEAEDAPRMISERARGVVRIVATWERLHAGTTHRCAYARARAAADAMARRLNAAQV